MSDEEKMSEQGLKLMLSFVLGDKKTESEDIKTKIGETLSKLPAYMDHPVKTKTQCSPGHEVAGLHISKRILKFEDPNLVLNIGAFAFKVNMEVLEIYSEYLRKSNQSEELTLPDEEVSPSAFVAIYEWMITDNPGLPRKGIVELYKAAHFLGVQQFLEQFWACVSNPLIIEDRAYVMYLEALAFDVPEIRRVMLNRISRFFLIIVSCEEFPHIPVDDLAQLLKSSLIGVNSEVEVYMACVRYFHFDWENRRENLLKVMKFIRYDFLPTNFVLELLNKDSEVDIPEVTRIVRHPELQDILRDLVQYHCLLAFPGPNSISIQKSLNRNWIFDPQCSYHSRESPRKTIPDYVNYVEFSSYMKYLSIAKTNHYENFKFIQIEAKSTSDEKIIRWNVIK